MWTIAKACLEIIVSRVQILRKLTFLNKLVWFVTDVHIDLHFVRGWVCVTLRIEEWRVESFWNYVNWLWKTLITFLPFTKLALAFARLRREKSPCMLEKKIIWTEKIIKLEVTQIAQVLANNYFEIYVKLQI